MENFVHYPEDSGMIVGDAYHLEYSKRNRQWTLRHPSDRRRAWRDTSLFGLVESVVHDALVYRYSLSDRDLGDFQPFSRTFEGILLAVASHPKEFFIPEECKEDYSGQELAFIMRWQEILIAGTASDEEAPVDVQSLSFKDAMELIASAGSNQDSDGD